MSACVCMCGTQGSQRPGPVFLEASSSGWLLSSQANPDTFQESGRTRELAIRLESGLLWTHRAGGKHETVSQGSHAGQA